MNKKITQHSKEIVKSQNGLTIPAMESQNPVSETQVRERATEIEKRSNVDIIVTGRPKK